MANYGGGYDCEFVEKPPEILQSKDGGSIFWVVRQRKNGALALHENFYLNDIHDYDVITVSREHCSLRFTGMLSLPATRPASI